MERAKRQKWNILSLLPAVIVVIIIFYYALQPGDASKESSAGVSMGLYQLFGGAITLTQAQFDTLNLTVRVFAHMGEYAFLGICIGYACTRNGIRRHLRAIYMILICLCISIADEFVQIFVFDRYGDPLDIVVDMLGVVIIAYAILRIRKVRTLHRPEGLEGKRRVFFNTRIDDVSFDEAVDRIMSYAAEEKPECRMLVTPNADHLIKLEKDDELKKIYDEADLITVDGTPLLWIAESFSCPLKEKVTGADLLPAVCERAAKEGRSMFFFATSDRVIELAKQKLCEEYPGLKIIGGYAPPMRFEQNKGEVERAVKKINKAAADILVVGLGCPKSEKFIYQNRKRLNAKVALPVGAAIAFAAGEQKRAPEWMQKRGLEWFYRFMQEPGRLFERYFINDIRIFFMALKYRDRTVAGYLGEEVYEDRDRSDELK